VLAKEAKFVVKFVTYAHRDARPITGSLAKWSVVSRPLPLHTRCLARMFFSSSSGIMEGLSTSVADFFSSPVALAIYTVIVLIICN